MNRLYRSCQRLARQEAGGTPRLLDVFAWHAPFAQRLYSERSAPPSRKAMTRAKNKARAAASPRKHKARGKRATGSSYNDATGCPEVNQWSTRTPSNVETSGCRARYGKFASSLRAQVPRPSVNDFAACCRMARTPARHTK